MRTPETATTPFSDPHAVAAPWPVALEAFRRSQKFWISTVRSDGRPHVTAALATWSRDGVVFATGDQEQKSRNLRANPQCVVSTGDRSLTGLDVVVEGRAELVTSPDERDTDATAFENAYGWHMTPPDGWWHFMPDGLRTGQIQLFHLRPSKAFLGDNGAPFGHTRYRW